MASYKLIKKFITILILLVGTHLPTHADSAAELKVKVALTYNFARYIGWPDDNSGKHFNLCVFSDPVLAHALKTIEGKNIGERTIRVVTTDLGDNLKACQLLKIGGKDRQRIALVLSAVKNHPTLTIGQLPDFIDRGGIINLYKEAGKFRFQINPHQAERSQLKVSSRLLRIAQIYGN